MSGVLALATFSLVSAITPGPNNVMLWASGVQFGLRRTLPHVIGISVGVGSMALLVATGLGVLITGMPAVEVALKVVGSVYLLYLGYQIVGGRVVAQQDVTQPLSPLQAITFQYVNPKAWVFVVAAVTTFRPTGMSVPAGTVAMALVMMLVVLPCAALWAGAGTLLSRFLADQERSLSFRVLLGLLLAATVVYIWL